MVDAARAANRVADDITSARAHSRFDMALWEVRGHRYPVQPLRMHQGRPYLWDTHSLLRVTRKAVPMLASSRGEQGHEALLMAWSRDA